VTILQAIVLGLVQGLGEFLPISSSAHLVLVPWLFKWQDPGLTFDIALHLGTLIAVLIFFWQDWIRLLRGGVKGWNNKDGRLFWYLVLATIPGGVIGILLEDKAETVFRTPLLTALMLILMGVVLYWADRRSKGGLRIDHIDLRTSLLIGLSQALAIIPGVSRSGITMTTALLSGMYREDAARFSFLLSTPIIMGAALIKIPELLHNTAMINTAFLVGVLVSALVGLASIGFLLSYVQTKNFLPFAWYRFILGALVIIVVFLR